MYGLAVRRLLEEYGLNSDSIKGTGRTNRLLKSDVLAYIQAHNVNKVAPKSGKCDAVLDLKRYPFWSSCAFILWIFFCSIGSGKD